MKRILKDYENITKDYERLVKDQCKKNFRITSKTIHSHSAVLAGNMLRL